MLFTPSHLRRLSSAELAELNRSLYALLPRLIEGSCERRTVVASLDAIRRERTRRHLHPGLG